MNTLSTVRVAGSIHMDVVVMVDRFPVPGETFRGNEWVLRPGGKGRNQAVSTARHFPRVHMMGAVGGDQFAPALLHSLKSAHVNIDLVAELERDVSGGSVAMIEPAGDSESVIVSSVNLRIPETTIKEFADSLSEDDVVVLQNEIPTEANESIATAAKQRRSTIVLNAAPYRPLTTTIRQSVDLLVVNEVEAEQYSGKRVTGTEEAEQAAHFILKEWNCTAVIVTLGKEGVVYSTSNLGTKRIAGIPVTSSDAHGAGDGFVGGLVSQLVQGASLDHAIRYANANAAAIVSTPFDKRHEVTPSDVNVLLNQES